MSTPFLETIKLHAQQNLRPLVTKIDQEGLYPKDYLMELGKLGGFSALSDQKDENSGLANQIAVIQAVGRECGATAFSVWCQSACAWYLYNTSRPAVREKYLQKVLEGKVLAGTGMSNTIKHLSKIEKHLLQAEKVAGGYRVNGILPWVSNIGEDHLWAATAQVSEDQFVMFIVSGNQKGVILNPCPQFSALEGTNTFAVRFNDLFVPESDLLADIEEFDDYIATIKPGFILLQIGIGAGIIEGCIQIMQESNTLTAHVNQYLDLTLPVATEKLSSLKQETSQLAQQVKEGRATLLPILKTRLDAAETTLAVAQSAALHAGAKGYLMRHSAQRRSREAIFVAIVTPAIKHLRQDIARLSA
ncbi:acyl-CoA dehydrogenase [Ignatzschineria indica]|uniref:Acyl-CoA dehydrogenase n=1 Tax=Ignatzschineria indica TaxID=472583 RepID=A0A2U2ALV2_9GAMM|nr:acyl-CoA dehydrogenase family protein [Ignatzschineria indica]PWD84189.1 acyl-CoA dehydrogenase [Ignatzschineria indica]GGZ74597.1 acyl-CoA dehydrogenase [Ignatzschineria indica]